MRWLLWLALGCGLVWGEPAGHEQNMVNLRSAGFRVAPSLPASPARQVRPAGEVARRVLAIHAVVLWVAAPPSRWSDEQVRAYVERWKLRTWMSADELRIIQLSRQEAHRSELERIGWKLENAWALAWVLGFDLEPGLTGQFSGDDLMRLVYQYLPGPGEASQQRFLEQARTRPAAQVLGLEDYFRCAHNAVRSAQLGRDTVPKGYDPIGEGGAVQERRHGLTWSVSPGVSWDDTDLST